MAVNAGPALGITAELKDIQKLWSRSEARFDQKVFYPEDASWGDVEADAVAQIPPSHIRTLDFKHLHATTGRR